MGNESLVVLDVPIETLSDPGAILDAILDRLGPAKAIGNECSEPDAGPSDGGTNLDADLDGGTEPDAACRHCPCSKSGCSCRTGGSGSDSEGMIWMIMAFLVALVYGRQRRRSGREIDATHAAAREEQ